MFNEPGPTIKAVSKILFFLNTVAVIVLAIVLKTFWIALGGIVFSYVECLLFFGFGELIENTGKTEKAKKEEEKIRREHTKEEPEPALVSEEEIEKELLKELENNNN